MNHLIRLCASLLVLVSLVPLAAQERLSGSDLELITETMHHAADVEATTAFCSGKNPASLTRNRAVLIAWQRRNHWNELRNGAAAHELADGKFEQLKSNATANLQKHGFASAIVCNALPQLFSNKQNDPSLQHGQDLLRIASIPVPSAPSLPLTTENAGTDTRSGSAPQNFQSERRTEEQQEDRPRTSDQQAPTAAATFSNDSTSRTPSSFGDTEFIPPHGWTVGRSTHDSALFTRPGKINGNLILSLSAGEMAGDFRTAFIAAVTSVYPGSGLNLKNITQAKTTSGLPALYVRSGGRLRANNKSARIKAVGVAAPGGRLYLGVLITASDSESDDMAGTKELEQVVASWHFRNIPASMVWNPLHPPVGSGGQKELYFGTHMQLTPNPLGGMDMLAQRDYVILFPNGQAYRDLPKDGRIFDMDFSAACAKTPGNCGTYRLQGSIISFMWFTDYGLVEESSSPVKPGKAGPEFEFNNATLSRVQPVQNLHLSGRFTSTFIMSGNTATNSSSVVSQTFIAFAPDGTYQKSGFTGTSFSDQNAGVSTNRRKGIQVGRYTLDGFSLILTPQTGEPPERFSAVFESISASPSAIFLNDSAFINDAKRR